MNKKLFSFETLFLALWSICIIVSAYHAGKVMASLDNTQHEIEMLLNDSSTHIEPFPNQGRIPDTTINGIDYYRAN
jgi:cbb3-type cytochrome oxidase subunit 3